MQLPGLPAFFVLLTGASAGCALSQLHATDSRDDKIVLGSLAVAPFANLSKAEQAERTIADHLVTQLHKRADLRLMDLTREESTDRIDRQTAREIGEQAGVDAVLYGTVLAYEYVGSTQHNRDVASPVPSIGVNVRLVSTRTGNILWAAGVVSSDPSWWTNTTLTLEQLAQEVATDLAASLAAELEPGVGDG